MQSKTRSNAHTANRIPALFFGEKETCNLNDCYVQLNCFPLKLKINFPMCHSHVKDNMCALVRACRFSALGIGLLINCENR